MFSGIVESVQPILKAIPGEGLLRIWVQRPPEFQDLKIGDSIAVDGVCLTIEKFSESDMQFALALETLHIVGWPQTDAVIGRRVNLERSLRYGDRIHGHLVTGHVQSVAQVRNTEQVGGSLFMDVDLPQDVLVYIWPKGSVTLNGVSLTVNEVQGSCIKICLIPETQSRTNLIDCKAGSSLNVEPDWMAKALTRALENQLQARGGAEKGVL